jgi:uncharacterized membrane protein
MDFHKIGNKCIVPNWVLGILLAAFAIGIVLMFAYGKP